MTRVAARPPATARPLPAGRHLAPVLGLVCAVLVTVGFGFGIHLPNLHNGLIATTFTAVGISCSAGDPAIARRGCSSPRGSPAR